MPWAIVLFAELSTTGTPGALWLGSMVGLFRLLAATVERPGADRE